MEKFLNLNKKQWNVIFVGIPGTIGIGFLSWYYPIIHNSLDKIHQIYLTEVFAAGITVTIMIIKKRTKTSQLDAYELLMVIFMGAIAGINLIPESLLNANVLITLSIGILVAWFVYFGLWRYIAEERQVDKNTFITILTVFIGLTVVIMMAFNIHRVVELFTP